MDIITQINYKLAHSRLGAFSADLKHPEWNRLYVKYNKYQGLVLSNIEAKHKGQGSLTRLIAALQAAGFTVSIECPQPQLRDWCVRNGINVIE